MNTGRALRVAARSSARPNTRYSDIGFRCVSESVATGPSMNDEEASPGEEVPLLTFTGQSTMFLLESKGDKKLFKFTLIEQPRNGKLTDKSESGKITLTYTPDSGLAGNDSFRYTVSDGTSESTVNRVNIMVKPQPAIMQFSPIESVSVNQSFTVQVLMDRIKNLAGWSFNLEYDPTILSLESVEEDDVLKAEGGTTFFQKGTVNEKEGTVTGLSSTYLGTGGVSNSGNLLTINLKSRGCDGYLRLKETKFGAPKVRRFRVKQSIPPLSFLAP